MDGKRTSGTPGGVEILAAEMLWPTRPVLELVDAARALAPAPGEAESPRYRAALIDLRNVLPGKADLDGWAEATGEPAPRNLAELERQGGAVGMKPQEIDELTPAAAMRYVRGALEREHRQRAGSGQDAAAGKPRRKRARKPALGKPLTDRQREAVEAVSDCGGNIADAARLLTRDPATVRQHYRAGMAKLGEVMASGKRPKTQAIPTDRRGQEQV